MIADSNGVFAQIFGVEGLSVDLVLKTSGDVTLYTQDDVVFVGANSGVITRDFTNSRLRMAGSGGIISIEAGDPTGDDVGGALRLGGYLGTQADTLSLDAAQTNTTGRFKENSKKLPAVVYTEATTFSAVAILDIPLPNDPVGARAWEVDIWDFSATTSANLRHRFSYDGGATYAAGATDYAYQFSFVSGSETLAEDNSDPYINLGSFPDGASNRPARFSYRVITPRSGNDSTTLEGVVWGMTYNGRLHGFGPTSAGPADHLRILPAAGTISGKYLVRPLRGFGEV